MLRTVRKDERGLYIIFDLNHYRPAPLKYGMTQVRNGAGVVIREFDGKTHVKDNYRATVKNIEYTPYILVNEHEIWTSQEHLDFIAERTAILKEQKEDPMAKVLGVNQAHIAPRIVSALQIVYDLAAQNSLDPADVTEELIDEARTQVHALLTVSDFIKEVSNK